MMRSPIHKPSLFQGTPAQVLPAAAIKYLVCSISKEHFAYNIIAIRSCSASARPGPAQVAGRHAALVPRPAHLAGGAAVAPARDLAAALAAQPRHAVAAELAGAAHHGRPAGLAAGRHAHAVEAGASAGAAASVAEGFRWQAADLQAPACGRQTGAIDAEHSRLNARPICATTQVNICVMEPCMPLNGAQIGIDVELLILLLCTQL